jgi:hypothetical protein
MRAFGILMLVLSVSIIAGCKKQKDLPPDSDPPPPVTANPQSGGAAIVPAGGVGVVVNPNAALGGGGGGGAVMSSFKAARRVGAQNEMNTLGQVISFMQNDLGRMPTQEQIMVELKQYPQLLQAIEDGAYILTGTNEAGGLWAYEVDADKTSGIALIGGRATPTRPEDLAVYFRK